MLTHFYVGLFSVPAHIIFVVSPINVLLNYLLGMSIGLMTPCALKLRWRSVWGPESIRLGFIGAPIATSISHNLMSILSAMYGIYFVPRTAWHPLTIRAFTHLGFLAKLSAGGVGKFTGPSYIRSILLDALQYKLLPRGGHGS